MNPEDLSLSEAAAAVRRCSLSPVEYVEALFRVMDRIESRIEAWVTVDRQCVLSEARTCEAEARKGHFRGPLHGVPVGIKDIFYTNGLRTTMGSVIFKDFVPDCDARAVTKLKQARGHCAGKNRHDGVCESRSGTESEPMAPRAQSGWIEQRFGSGRCRADVSCGGWNANRRVRREARCVLRCGITGSSAAQNQPAARFSFGVVAGSRRNFC